jgi:hypothetical protein
VITKTLRACEINSLQDSLTTTCPLTLIQFRLFWHGAGHRSGVISKARKAALESRVVISCMTRVASLRNVGLQGTALKKLVYRVLEVGLMALSLFRTQIHAPC